MDLYKKNYEIITEELQRIIDSGIIQPGEKLDTIENLAKQYHVSRSTIREALSQLKALGMIESKQGGGTYVRQTSKQSFELLSSGQQNELLELLEVRKIVEIGSIELAAKHRNEENLEELERIVRQMESVVGNEDMSQVYDVNFHLAIARATQNSLLQKMIESISASMMRTMRESRNLWLYGEKTTVIKLFEEHKEMLAAIKEQDEKTAVEIMKSHLNKVGAFLKSKQ